MNDFFFLNPINTLEPELILFLNPTRSQGLITDVCVYKMWHLKALCGVLMNPGVQDLFCANHFTLTSGQIILAALNAVQREVAVYFTVLS